MKQRSNDAPISNILHSLAQLVWLTLTYQLLMGSWLQLSQQRVLYYLGGNRGRGRGRVGVEGRRGRVGVGG